MHPTRRHRQLGHSFVVGATCPPPSTLTFSLPILLSHPPRLLLVGRQPPFGRTTCCLNSLCSQSPASGATVSLMAPSDPSLPLSPSPRRSCIPSILPPSDPVSYPPISRAATLTAPGLPVAVSSLQGCLVAVPTAPGVPVAIFYVGVIRSSKDPLVERGAPSQNDSPWLRQHDNNQLPNTRRLPLTADFCLSLSAAFRHSTTVVSAIAWITLCVP